jgi:hypothetical protein
MGHFLSPTWYTGSASRFPLPIPPKAASDASRTLSKPADDLVRFTTICSDTRDDDQAAVPQYICRKLHTPGPSYQPSIALLPRVSRHTACPARLVAFQTTKNQASRGRATLIIRERQDLDAAGAPQRLRTWARARMSHRHWRSLLWGSWARSVARNGPSLRTGAKHYPEKQPLWPRTSFHFPPICSWGCCPDTHQSLRGFGFGREALHNPPRAVPLRVVAPQSGRTWIVGPSLPSPQPWRKSTGHHHRLTDGLGFGSAHMTS